MNLKFIPASFIFVGSYLPLSLILLIQDIDDKSWRSDFCLSTVNACVMPSLKNSFASLSFSAICIISCIFLIFYFLNEVSATDEVFVESSKPIPNDLIKEGLQNSKSGVLTA